MFIVYLILRKGIFKVGNSIMMENIYFRITFFLDLTFNIYFLLEKQAFNGLLKVFGIEMTYHCF